MARFLVIENELKFQTMLKETIKLLDAQASIELFDNFLLFNQKVNHLTADEKKQFLDFDLSLLGFGDLPLKDWKKTFDDFSQLPRKATPICLTGYENGALTLKYLLQFHAYNFIYKPFDPLILKEAIYLAMQNEKKAKTHEIKSQTAAALIGILKEVEIQSISELGFLTLSDSPIPLMSVSKYFSHLFKIGKKQSVWAQCLVSAAHPQKPGFYINKFQFYAVDKIFLNQMRKYIISFKQNETSNAFWNLNTTSVGKNFKMALVAPNNPENQNLRKDIEAHYKNLSVDLVDLGQKDQQAKTYEHDLVMNMTALEFDQINSFFKQEAQFFWMPAVAPPEEKMKELAGVYKDIFVQPFDKSYFYKKLKAIVNDLNAIETLSMLNITCHEKIKAANMARITEISEVFVNFNYPRELDFRTFREFIFLNQDEGAAVEIPAFCHFKEKIKNPPADEKNVYFHQFVFYGMTDHFLKEIRLWLLHNHVLQHKKD
jgi:FixJ family two-component response regulator